MQHVIQLPTLRKALAEEFNIDEYILNSSDDVFGAIQLLVEAEWVFDSQLSGVAVDWSGDVITLSVDDARQDVNRSLSELQEHLARYA
ncbi:hypothetical protein HS125_12885 [bacterium]|nr:hypothetical protein [bacterium]